MCTRVCLAVPVEKAQVGEARGEEAVEEERFIGDDATLLCSAAAVVDEEDEQAVRFMGEDSAASAEGVCFKGTDRTEVDADADADAVSS